MLKSRVRFLLILFAIGAATSCADGSVVTLSEGEGPVVSRTLPPFVGEEALMDSLMQMLADFLPWVKADYQPLGDSLGCFRGEDTMAANERGVRPNADLSMVCAFLCRYGKDAVRLPDGVSWHDVETMARGSLSYAVATHKAVRLVPCRDGRYWGSVNANDAQWESSLWALSVAFSAAFQRETLSDEEWQRVHDLLAAECQYELERKVPFNVWGDTKAEENGWETNVLACALALFPDDERAPRWFDAMRRFAVNCYSHPSDAADVTVPDPDYDGTTIADLYVGANLYDDYTLQNHGYFHTSYQNVVMQELGESLLALRLFAPDSRWQSRTLLHNVAPVMDQVLADLALADGELAMPNGNDWSLFLYDQITSYTTAACFLRHPDALMLENLAFHNVRARQLTTTDGSWLLRPDVGARRMGVQAHRVMMTWLMHHVASTADVVPTEWEAFRAAHADARCFSLQHIYRSYTAQRFCCFSWCRGLNSYTGYFTSNDFDNKIIVPFKKNGTGSIIGWYDVEGCRTDARPLSEPVFEADGDAFTLRGSLLLDQGALTLHFRLRATHGDAVVYTDTLIANRDVTVTADRGGMLAISTDPFLRPSRDVLTGGPRHRNSASWATVDDRVSVLSDATLAWGDESVDNSIATTKLYAFHSDSIRSYATGDTVGIHRALFFTSLPARDAAALAKKDFSKTIERYLTK